MTRALAFLTFCILWTATCSSCASTMRPDLVSVFRSHDLQKETAIHVVVSCSNYPPGVGALGSGVVISPTDALTAAHVVDCKSDLDGTSGQVVSIIGVQQSGVGVKMKVIAVEPSRDIARLQIADDATFIHSGNVRVGPVPKVGQRVCMFTGAPSRDVRCGFIEDTMRKRAAHDLAIGVPVEPGNSGSGLWDHFGRLVGIVTQRRGLQNGQSSGGMATSFHGFEGDAR